MRIYCCECGQDTGVETDCEVTRINGIILEARDMGLIDDKEVK